MKNNKKVNQEFVEKLVENDAAGKEEKKAEYKITPGHDVKTTDDQEEYYYKQKKDSHSIIY